MLLLQLPHRQPSRHKQGRVMNKVRFLVMTRDRRPNYSFQPNQLVANYFPTFYELVANPGFQLVRLVDGGLYKLLP